VGDHSLEAALRKVAALPREKNFPVGKRCGGSKARVAAPAAASSAVWVPFPLVMAVWVKPGQKQFTLNPLPSYEYLFAKTLEYAFRATFDTAYSVQYDGHPSFFHLPSLTSLRNIPTTPSISSSVKSSRSSTALISAFLTFCSCKYSSTTYYQNA